MELAQQLGVLNEANKEAEEDLVMDFTSAGERLFIKPHGAGKQKTYHTAPWLATAAGQMCGQKY